MRNQIDRIKQKAGSAVVLVGWADEGKVGLLAAVTDDLVQKGLHAGKLIGQVAKVVGGGGGGKPTMAQAGGKEPAKLGEALQLGRQLVENQPDVNHGPRLRPGNRPRRFPSGPWIGFFFSTDVCPASTRWSFH